MNKVSGENFFKIVDRVTAQYFATTDKTEVPKDQVSELTQ